MNNCGYDDFWYDVRTFDESTKKFLPLHMVRMQDGGYTPIQDLPQGILLILGKFHDIVLADLGPLEISAGLGAFLRYYVPSALPVTVQLLELDRKTPIQNADIIVTANGPSGRFVRGGSDPRWRVLTDKSGTTTLWLYPTKRPEDFYVISAHIEGRLIASSELRLAPSLGAPKKVLTLVSEQ